MTDLMRIACDIAIDTAQPQFDYKLCLMVGFIIFALLYTLIVLHFTS